MLGREFVDAEAARPNSPPTAVIIGYDLWRRRFNSDPGIVGRAIRISRMPAPLPVVGVMPPGVRFLPDPGDASEPNYDVDAPRGFLARRDDRTRATQSSGGWNVVSRLRRERARRRPARMWRRFPRGWRATDPDLQGLTATAQPLWTSSTSRDVGCSCRCSARSRSSS